MPATEPGPLDAYFKEGMAARASGKTSGDNPYSAGSIQRREWDAGFSATTETEDEDGLDLDPNENATRHDPG